MIFLKNLFFGTVLLLLAFVSTVSASAALHPANGMYSIRPECAPDREMNVEYGSQNSGANVIIYRITSHLSTGANARWYIERVQGDWYKITAAHSGLALNVSGSNVDMAVYSGEAQLFKFVDVGGGYCIIQPYVNLNYAVDVSNGNNSDGTNVIVWSYHGNSNQRWKLFRL